MLSPEEIDALYKRMDVHRFHLSTYLQQKTMFGDAHVPPIVLLGIQTNRSSIQHLKETLRGRGVDVEDHPDDFDPVAQSITTPPVILSDEELEALWIQAEQAFTKHDWETAEPLLLQIASVNPRYREVQRLLSRTKKNLGLLAEYRRLCTLEDSQWREAKSRLEFIRKESSNFPDSQNLLGWIAQQEWYEDQYEFAEEYVNYGDLANARKILTEILKIKTDDQSANKLLEYIVEVEEEETERQHHAGFLVRQTQERRQWEVERKEENTRKDVQMAIGIIVVLVILIVIASTMPR